MSMLESEFPAPIEKNGRKFFIRHQIENYKRSLAGMTLIAEDAVRIVEFVPAQQAADELGVNRRTLGRRMRGKSAGADEGDKGRAA